MRFTVLLAALLMFSAGCAAPDVSPGPSGDGIPTSGTDAARIEPDVQQSPSADADAEPVEEAPPACPGVSLQQRSYEAAERFLENLEGEALTLRVQGTVEGVVETVTAVLDPARENMRFTSSAEGIDLRFNGAYYSGEADDVAFFGRDHRLDGAFRQTYVDFLAEMHADEGESFLDDLTWSDYEARCTTLSGVEVIEFTYDDGTNRETLIVQKSEPHRPLSGTVVDPALQDNFRVSLNYAPADVQVDRNAPRVPITLSYSVVDTFTNERGGLYLSAIVAQETEWAPLSELYFDLIDAEGNLYFHTLLEDGSYDLEDGDIFEFRDRNSDGKLSPGDTFFMDLGPGLDIAFWDDWAQAYTDSVASA